MGVAKVYSIGDLWGLALHTKVLERRARVHVTGKDGKGEAEAPRSPVGPRPGSAGSVDAEPAGMRVQMIQHNIDRKVAAPAKLIKAFDLPADAD